jgi:hypothetical protein
MKVATILGIFPLLFLFLPPSFKNHRRGCRRVSIFMSPGVVDTGAHLGVGNMWVCPESGCLAKFVQAVRKSCVIIGKGQGGDMI